MRPGECPLLLESPGGTLLDGVELGQEVRSSGLRTVARYECASACAIIFLGGAERLLVGSRARIGFHQAALIGEKVRRCDRAIDSPGVVMNTSCDSIEWIYGQRARELGVATRLESEGVDVFGPRADR